jgi:hypothetical protein
MLIFGAGEICMRKAFGFIVALVLLLGVIGLIILGIHAKDRYDKAEAMPRAQANWKVVRAQVASRIENGQYPLELGAVWTTHAGRICGLVNGGSAFGGLTGMMPFYQEGDRVRFKIETDPLTWAGGWRECNNDMWLELNQGSYETGYCATRRGQSRCKTVGG